MGIGLVEYGPLQGWLARLKEMRIPASDGGPVTLSSVTGLPFWALALILAGATLAWSLARPRRRAAPAAAPISASPVRLNRPWKAWQAGIAIGLLALPAYMSSVATGRSYPLGVATGCVIGNILSGWALMSVGMFVFGVVTVLANWATTVLYLRGID